MTSIKQRAWVAFDELVARTDLDSQESNPWRMDANGGVVFDPDFAMLRDLLAVPLALKAPTTSGVPALALDVWIAYELRRAWLAPDGVWPRASAPRMMPASVARLLASLPRKEAETLRARLTSSNPPQGVVASSANILGKHYLKQVDVVMSDWATGPELLISTKRMDSSFGKNAANRVEESYGDAKNLRLRHPLASIGFFYGLRSTIFDLEPDKANWLIDLLQKLGQEDDAYHAVALLVVDYDDEDQPLEDDDLGDGDDVLEQAMDPLSRADPEPMDVSTSQLGVDLSDLPRVDFRQELVPPQLQPSHFFGALVNRLLASTPVNFHVRARERRSSAI